MLLLVNYVITQWKFFWACDSSLCQSAQTVSKFNIKKEYIVNSELHEVTIKCFTRCVWSLIHVEDGHIEQNVYKWIKQGINEMIEP